MKRKEVRERVGEVRWTQIVATSDGGDQSPSGATMSPASLSGTLALPPRLPLLKAGAKGDCLRDYDGVTHAFLQNAVTLFEARILSINAFPTEKEQSRWTQEIWADVTLEAKEPQELTKDMRSLVRY